LISIGNINILFMISERKFKELEELEVVVRFLVYYSIFYNIMSVVDNWEAGKEADILYV